MMAAKVIDACASSKVLPGVRMVWTKCDMDVPDDQGFTVEGEAPAITYPECLRGMAKDKHDEQARPSMRNRRP